MLALSNIHRSSDEGDFRVIVRILRVPKVTEFRLKIVSLISTHLFFLIISIVTTVLPHSIVWFNIHFSSNPNKTSCLIQFPCIMCLIFPKRLEGFQIATHWPANRMGPSKVISQWGAWLANEFENLPEPSNDSLNSHIDQFYVECRLLSSKIVNFENNQK